MLKKIFLVSCSVATICLSLLAGCSASAPLAPNAASAPQPVDSAPATALTPSQGSPLPQPTSRLLTNPPAAQNIVVNMPSFSDLLDVAEHSVVKIDIVGTVTNIFGRTVQLQGAGSGWIMDSNGTIVTNNHVVEGATTINVTTLDGKTYPARLVNADSVADLAVLKINADQLPALKVGDASKLRVGEWVLAIGNPLGEGIIATQGIVSRLKVDLSISSTQTYNDLIETTAAINPGNSGGPLVNMAGEVIGITSAKVSASGIEGMGYAINMVDALPVIQRLSAAK